MKIAVIKQDNNTFLIPYALDRDYLQKYKNGAMFTVAFSKAPRNLKHHRKLFAILRLVVDNCDDFDTVEDLLRAVKYELDYVYKISLLNGEHRLVTDSINFDKMDQGEFEDFYDQAVVALAKHLGVCVTELEMNSNRYL